jgi:hypothetical protein
MLCGVRSIVGSVSLLALAVGFACGETPIEHEGQLGRPIPLASGDSSPLPRLAFIDEGCPGESGLGGCPAGGERSCQPLLVDTLSPFTAIRRNVAGSSFALECLEVRAAGGLAADPPAPEDLAGAVARFRFHELPMVRGPMDGGSDWRWTAGDHVAQIEPGGVLGGNVLRQFAVRIRSPRGQPASLTFFGEFPGSERELANEGRAYLGLQFPGRLLGRLPTDRCGIGGGDCALDSFDFQQSQPEAALRRSLMVLDGCVAAPPCSVRYDGSVPPARCSQRRGPQHATACEPADHPTRGGKAASLVVASGVTGLVLFADSARRMFGDLDALPTCDRDVPVRDAAPDDDLQACLVAVDGRLYVSGWPPAGEDTPLARIRVRSLGLVPGNEQTRDPGPCVRLQRRRDALAGQCSAFLDALEAAADIRDTTPPYAADGANTSLAVLGEAFYGVGQETPETDRWVETLVLPETHQLALSVRRMVVPEAIEPDGLLGTALFDDTVAVLDYTNTSDDTPGVRLSCIDPREGDCTAAPRCEADAQPACCFGLPLNLLEEFIVRGEDDTCCPALTAAELEEVQQLGRCANVPPP